MDSAPAITPRPRRAGFCAALTLAALTALPAAARDWVVDAGPAGGDTHDGTPAAPLRSLAAAVARA